MGKITLAISKQQKQQKNPGVVIDNSQGAYGTQIVTKISAKIFHFLHVLLALNLKLKL